MITSLIASGSCSSGTAFAFLLLLLLKVSPGSQVLGWLELQTDKSGQEKTDDCRRDELVHFLLHSLRLPCPHKKVALWKQEITRYMIEEQFVRYGDVDIFL
jgi:hypothetical protein